MAQAVADGEAVVVVHGVDYNDSGKYDGKAKSDLDPKLPTEATDPALCGILEISQVGSVPTGGIETGSGSTTGVESEGIIALGGVAMHGGLALAMRRRFVSSS